MHSRIDALFADSLERLPLDAALPGGEAVEVKLDEEPDAYVVHVKAPDSDDTKLEASMDGQLLTIRGDRSTKHEVVGADDSEHTELQSSHFEEQLTLPDPVKASTLTTEYADGVYTIRVDKA